MSHGSSDSRRFNPTRRRSLGIEDRALGVEPIEIVQAPSPEEATSKDAA